MRRRRIQAAAALLAALAAAAALRAEAIPEVDPIGVYTYGAGSHMRSAQLSPDGATLYVQLAEEGLNVWAALVSLWPEVLGGVAALVALALVIMIVRRVRAPQEVGAPHCRGCGYNLRGHASQVHRPDTAREGCPECGVNLIRRPPRRGRSVLRRTWHLGVLAAAVVSVYGGMHAAGLPRRGPAAGWFLWRWAALERYAERKGWTWTQDFRRSYARILALDAATGEARRPARILARPGTLPMVLSPDGRTLIVSRGERGLVALDARTGRRIRSHQAPATKTVWTFRYDHIAGFSPDSTTVYAVRIDEADWVTRVIAWNFTTGAVATILEEPAARVTSPRGTLPVCRRYEHVPGTDPPEFVSVPGFPEAFDTKKYDVQLHRGGERTAVAQLGATYALEAPVVDPSGERFFISGMHRGIDGYDLRTGESLGTLPPPEYRDTGWDKVAVSPDGRFLYWATVVTDSVLVRDVNARRWAARLRTPDMLSPLVHSSADGRRIAAYGALRNGNGGSGIVGAVVRVFDLPEASPGAAGGGGPGDAPGGGAGE